MNNLLYRKLLTTLRLMIQDLPDEDYRALHRNLRAVEKYLENKILEGGGRK